MSNLSTGVFNASGSFERHRRASVSTSRGIQQYTQYRAVHSAANNQNDSAYGLSYNNGVSTSATGNAPQKGNSGTATNNTGYLMTRRRASTSVMGHRGQAAQPTPVRPGHGAVTLRQNNPLSTELSPPSVDPLGINIESWSPPEDLHQRENDYYMKIPITDLVRAYTILNACQVVGKFPRSLEWATHTFQKYVPGPLQDLVYGTTVKPTFFGHFCGGATLKEVFNHTRPRLAANGLGVILEYSVECDIGGESREADKAADGVRDEILRAILASRADAKTRVHDKKVETGLEENMIAIKISALCPPTVLYRVSEVHTALKQCFQKLETKFKGNFTINDLRAEMPWFQWFESECRDYVRSGAASKASADARLMSVETSPVYMTSLFNNGSRKVEWFDIERMLTTYLFFLTRPVSNAPGPFNIITAEDKIAWNKLAARVSAVCSEAAGNVPLLVDAEQTYFNPAINLITTQMSCAYNRKYPTLWYTQQLYLKAGVSEVENYVAKAKRESWIPALKLVRGAYMVSERLRAKDLRIADPIHNTIQDTHRAYKDAIQFLLVNQSADPYVLIASHNEDSIKYTSGLMRHGVSMSNRVAFAQLKGMCDSIGVDLARQGFTTLKWVPYGPVGDAVPYLVRRVQENATLLDAPAAREDLRQMKEALVSRLGLSRFSPPVSQ